VAGEQDHEHEHEHEDEDEDEDGDEPEETEEPFRQAQGPEALEGEEFKGRYTGWA